MAIATGWVEEMCSVLTLGVGRHFFLMFNIVEMLEHPTEHTVPAVEKLFWEIIFNPELIKLWWNPSSDFAVMSTTLAQMYQGDGPQEGQHGSYRDEIDQVVET
ncbi:hypothetical protein LTR86_007327 [Recurvomyces mirabilis]|nr:hypothetical protein LTR86_007327 [Recurvomyces mirabilis]